MISSRSTACCATIPGGCPNCCSKNSFTNRSRRDQIRIYSSHPLLVRFAFAPGQRRAKPALQMAHAIELRPRGCSLAECGGIETDNHLPQSTTKNKRPPADAGASWLKCSSAAARTLEDDFAHELNVASFAGADGRGAVEVADGVTHQAEPPVCRVGSATW